MWNRLVEVPSGRLLATLEAPDIFPPAVFTPDGTRIVTADSAGIAVWDLRSLRRELAALGLDWDAPPFPEPPASAPTRPLRVEVVGADRANLGWREEYLFPATLIAPAVNPFDADARARLGAALLNKGQPAAALAQLNLALALKPDLTVARQNRAEAEFRLGRWPAVVADSTRVIRKAPSNRMMFLRAQAYQHLGQHPLALADLNALLKGYPNDPKLYRLRADSHAALGHAAEAKADRNRAVELVGEDPRQLNNLA